MSTGKKRKREEGNEETDGQVPDEFCCSISQEVMVDPVIAIDGHCYDRESITEWFRCRQPPTSPKTGVVLTSTELIPNHNLRQAIQEWRETQPMAINPAHLEVSSERLGEGSFGEVFVGTLKNGRAQRIRVAVKRLPSLDAQREREAFEKELKAHRHAAMHCSGICVLYGTCVGPEDQRLCIVMKRYEYSLDTVIDGARRAGTTLDTKRVVSYAISLFGTLRDLHDCGLVLRDIKPPNILIGAYDKPVFSDFGISEIVRTMTRIQQTSIKGTFNYMPPEAFQVGAVGPAIDIWGLACVIIEMSTLKVPWEGMRMEQIMFAVCMDKHAPEVPDSAPAAPFLRRCFAFTPTERPSTSQMIEAFVGLQEITQREAQNEVVRMAAAMEQLELEKEELGRRNAELNAVLKEEPRAATGVGAIEDELMVKLREYNLEHIAPTFASNGFRTMKRVQSMDHDDVKELNLPRGDAKDFEEMRKVLEEAEPSPSEKSK